MNYLPSLSPGPSFPSPNHDLAIKFLDVRKGDIIISRPLNLKNVEDTELCTIILRTDSTGMAVVARGLCQIPYIHWMLESALYR